MPRRLQRILFFGVLIGWAGGAFGATLYVAPGGGHVSPFTSWANAATNIESALAVSVNNDILLVSNGTYRIGSTLNISQRNLRIEGVNGPGVAVIDGGSARQLITVNERQFNLHGMTLRNGTAANGGGVLVNAYVGIVISNCVFDGNAATTDGGGALFSAGSAGVITGCRFTRNSGSYGGGLCSRSAITVSNCVFEANSASGGPGTGGAGIFWDAAGTIVDCRFYRNTSVGNDGAGVLVNSGAVTIDRCLFANNTADDWGGAVTCYGTGATIQNCIMRGNRADEGGAVFLNAANTIRNCTMVRNRANTAVSSGGGIKIQAGVIENNIIYFNDPDNYLNLTAVAYSNNCTAPMPSGTGNFTNDPLFLYEPEAELHLATNSPCLNAGTNRAWMTGATDYERDTRIIQNVVDVGADERGPLVCYFTATPVAGAPPLSVQFTSYVTGTNTIGLFYRWDFNNDGTDEITGSASNAPAYVYTNSGTYTIRLIVTNAAREVASLVRTNYVAVENTRYVAPGGSHVSPFTNWVQAATNLEAAVAVTGPGGTIRVSNGLYRLRSEVAVTSAMSIASVNGPAVTIFNGPATTRCFRIVSGVTLAGFTISNGYAVATSPGVSNAGGGVLFSGGGTVSNCVLTGNRAAGVGGAACLNGGGVLTHSILSGNSAFRGAAAGAFSGGDIVNCLAYGNAASDRGGGVYLQGNSVLRNSLLYRNTAATNGGGVAIFNSGGTVQNCTIVTNWAVSGGGVHCENAGNVHNSIMYLNAATGGGPNWQTLVTATGYGFFFTYDCTTPLTAIPDGTGCISNAPVFAAPATNNYRLTPTSPGVDVGQVLAWMTGATDLDGRSRILGASVDMGCYELLALLLEITNTLDKARLPFRATRYTVAGQGINLAGAMWYSNQWAKGVNTGSFPASNDWSTTLTLPAAGEYRITVYGTNTAGNMTADTVTVRRAKSQVFRPGP